MELAMMRHARDLVFSLALAAFAWSAAAGEVHETGGIGIKGYDPVAYFAQGRPVTGKPELSVEHGGVTYRFATPEHRDAFRAEPAKYLPQYGGFCAFGVAGGYKADIDPEAFSLVGGKLYLNYSKDVRAKWQQDVPGYIGKADVKWPEVAKTEKVHR
jgi:YHS domain-containing protein